MRLVDCLERADVAWCAIGGVAVNHWAEQPMVTQDVDFVVATDAVERTVALLEEAGFRAERFEWSVNFKGRSAVSLQLSTEEFYRDFPSRAVPADVHGILMRVASLDDTLTRQDQGLVRARTAAEQAHQGPGRHRPPGGGAPRALGCPTTPQAADPSTRQGRDSPHLLLRAALQQRLEVAAALRWHPERGSRRSRWTVSQDGPARTLHPVERYSSA